MFPATVFTLDILPAVVLTFAILPATVLTLLMSSATVLIELLPDPVFIASVINPLSSVNVTKPVTWLIACSVDWLGCIGVNPSPELPS